MTREKFHSSLRRIRSGVAKVEPTEVETFCEACSPPRIPRYEGLKLVLEHAGCNCKCPDTVFEPRGPRCPRCDHLVKIELTDRWDDPFIWIDPKTHSPVKLDEVKPLAE